MTFTSYGTVQPDRQAEIIHKIGEAEKPKESDAAILEQIKLLVEEKTSD